MNVAYGDLSYPTNGPFVNVITSDGVTSQPPTYSLAVEFDQAITFDASETNGFYVCCGVEFEVCDTQNGLWQLVRILLQLLITFLERTLIRRLCIQLFFVSL